MKTVNPQYKTRERRDPHMQKNIKQIMIALDQVLNTTVWVNQDRQIISLSDELHIGNITQQLWIACRTANPAACILTDFIVSRLFS